MVWKNWIFKVILILFGLGLSLDLISKLIAESLWFEEVGYFSVFRVRLLTEGGLGLLGFSATAFWLFGNLILAQRYKYSPPQKDENFNKPFFNFSPPPLPKFALGLTSLLLLVISMALLLGLLLLHYGQVFISYWQPDWNQSLVSPLLPSQFEPETIQLIMQQLAAYAWEFILLVVIIIGLLWKPLLLLSISSGFLSLGFGLVLASHWSNVLQFFNPTVFNQTDSLLGRDIGFYIFILPALNLLEFWLLGLFLVSFIGCSLIYLLSGNSISQGRFSGFSQPQQRHLHGLAGFLMLSVSLRYWLARYELLYSNQGVIFGAGYREVMALKPAYLFLSISALLIALFLFWQAIFSVKKIRPYIEIGLRALGFRRHKKHHHYSVDKLFSDSYSLRTIFTWYLGVVLITTLVIPSVVQRLIVQPNELERELPYIKRSIEYTRQAFNLAKINVETFDPNAQLTYADLQNNKLTVDNIRLWDQQPLLQTNRQLQQIRLYYEFPVASYDRYLLPQLNKTNNSADSFKKQQIIISPRELNYESVPDKAKTWVNKHLVYTHGYGFTLSPVNTVGEGGLPEYFVRDIGADPIFDPNSTLQVAAQIRNSIPIGKPRIYYGLLTNTDVMTSTQVKELDYPAGNENIYNTYDGQGGIVIGTGWRRWLFANYLRNWQMLFTDNFTPETKILFRRNILERVKAIAPFLRYDSNPYLVVANPSQDITSSTTDKPIKFDDQNYLYWIIDAYTTSRFYPYSDPEEADVNYIRNSVKIVIDAYNGSMKFYYLGQNLDPIITTWRKIFPNLFSPIEEMPASLYRHIRYPIDLFKIQSQHLLTYHMTDPIVFYNREDLWRVPVEIYGNQQQSLEPYYLIMRLPTERSEEFIILQPFTPASRNNLIAWLSARSDQDDYGKLLLYRFPKQRLIFGPEQVEALINQDPDISEQISLWNRQGSRVIQGNLLVIPIEQSLLYVEPLYLEAAENSLPTLVRVIVASENRIVMRPTLDQALRDVFQVQPVSPAVIPELPDNPTS